MFGRQSDVAERVEAVPQVDMRIGVVRLDRQCAPRGVDRVGDLATLALFPSQAQQRLNVVGLDRQGLQESRFCLGRLTRRAQGVADIQVRHRQIRREADRFPRQD